MSKLDTVRIKKKNIFIRVITSEELKNVLITLNKLNIRNKIYLFRELY